ELRKRLPHRKTVVETEDGIGEVQDTQILTQLVLVRIPGQPGAAAYPLENIRILSKEESKAWHAEQRQLEKERAERDAERAERRASRYGGKPRPEPRRPRPGQPLQDGEVESKEGTIAADLPPDASPNAADATGQPVSRGYGNAVTGD